MLDRGFDGKQNTFCTSEGIFSKVFFINLENLIWTLKTNIILNIKILPPQFFKFSIHVNYLFDYKPMTSCQVQNQSMIILDTFQSEMTQKLLEIHNPRFVV